MNNKEFIAALSSSMEMTVPETQKMVNDFVEELSCRFDESKDVVLHGFGVFELKKRAERLMVHPTGKKILVPPKLTLSFKLSETFKNKIKES